MKYKIMFFSVVVLAILGTGMYAQARFSAWINPPSAEAAKELPERAKLLGSWIDEKVEARKAQLEAKANLEAQLTQLNIDIAQIEGASVGFRKSLCSEFKLLRQNGAFEEAADCVSFQ